MCPLPEGKKRPPYIWGGGARHGQRHGGYQSDDGCQGGTPEGGGGGAAWSQEEAEDKGRHCKTGGGVAGTASLRPQSEWPPFRQLFWDPKVRKLPSVFNRIVPSWVNPSLPSTMLGPQFPGKGRNYPKSLAFSGRSHSNASAPRRTADAIAPTVIGGGLLFSPPPPRKVLRRWGMS